MPTSQSPARPWTPTERPGDDSYVSPVVYHGSNQLSHEDSEVSPEEEAFFPTTLAAQARLSKLEAARIRFKSSQALRDDAFETAPEAQLYSLYQQSQNQEAPPRRDKSAKIPEGDRGDRLPANNPYRMSQALKAPDQLRSTKSSEILNQYRQSEDPPSAQLGRASSAEALSKAYFNQPQSTYSRDIQQQPPIPTIAISDDLPSVTGTSLLSIKILLINPNSTASVTQRCLETLSSTLPANVTVSGFTAPYPSPTAIESQTDAILSTSICLSRIQPIAEHYDGFLVACFSHHPLIAALRDALTQPVIGIMEASLYAARMCGGKFGIITTSQRSTALHAMSVQQYGLDDFCVGTESTVRVLELERRLREAEKKVGQAARELQRRGADCICLGCAGMMGFKKACQDAVGAEERAAMVIDGVAVGVHFLIALVREGLGTPKGLEHRNGKT